MKQCSDLDARKASSSGVLGASSINCNRQSQVHWQSCWCKITDLSVGAEARRSLAPLPSLDGKYHGISRRKIWGQSAQPKSLQSRSSWKPFLSTWRTRRWLGTASIVLQRLDCTHPTSLSSRTGGGSVQTKGEQWMLSAVVLAKPFLGLLWHCQLVWRYIDWISGQYHQAQSLR